MFKRSSRNEPSEKKRNESVWKVSPADLDLDLGFSISSPFLYSEAQKPIWEREAVPAAEPASENPEEKDKGDKKKKKKKKKKSKLAEIRGLSRDASGRVRL